MVGETLAALRTVVKRESRRIVSYLGTDGRVGGGGDDGGDGSDVSDCRDPASLVVTLLRR